MKVVDMGLKTGDSLQTFYVLCYIMYFRIYSGLTKCETKSIADFKFTYLNAKIHTSRKWLISKKGFDQSNHNVGDRILKRRT